MSVVLGNLKILFCLDESKFRENSGGNGEAGI